MKREQVANPKSEPSQFENRAEQAAAPAQQSLRIVLPGPPRPAYTLEHYDLMRTGAPNAVGRPFGYFFGQNVAVYRGSDGNLRDVWWSDGLPGFEVLAAHGAPPFSVNPFAYFDSEGFQHVIYTGNDGALHDLYWSTGQPLDTNLTSDLVSPWQPVGDPQAYIAGGFHVAVYRGGDSHMHDVSWRSGVSPKHEYLTGPLAAQTRATDPDGDPFVYVDPNGVQVVVYRGTDDDLHALWWTTGVPGHDNLTVESNGPKVAGNPSVVLDVPRGIQVAFYRTTDGRLYRMYWPFGAGTPFTDELTAGFPSASLPAGDPCSYLVAEDGTYHVVYRSQDGHLQLLRWTTGAVACEDLTVLAGAPTAVDDPSAYFVPEYRTHHVIYRSGDGHLHELRWFPLTPFRGV